MRYNKEFINIHLLTIDEVYKMQHDHKEHYINIINIYNKKMKLI